MKKTYVFKEGRNNYHCVNLDDIIYIKADKGRTVITCNTIEIKSPLPFNEVLKVMGNTLFQCHRSYAINLEKITKFNSDNIYFTTYMINLGSKYKDVFFEKMLTKQNQITSL